MARQQHTSQFRIGLNIIQNLIYQNDREIRLFLTSISVTPDQSESASEAEIEIDVNRVTAAVPSGVDGDARVGPNGQSLAGVRVFLDENPGRWFHTLPSRRFYGSSSTDNKVCRPKVRKRRTGCGKSGSRIMPDKGRPPGSFRGGRRRAGICRC
uniref:Uncharacterized protein n=1 Tax=Romanomermis culicivorax TaxID=13658 RepID=A0A915KMX3_ROMCU